MDIALQAVPDETRSDSSLCWLASKMINPWMASKKCLVHSDGITGLPFPVEISQRMVKSLKGTSVNGRLVMEVLWAVDPLGIFLISGKAMVVNRR